MKMRLVLLMFLLICAAFPAAADEAAFLAAVLKEYPGWEVLQSCGLDGGVLAVLKRGDEALTVIADQTEAGETCFQVNDRLFLSVPDCDDLWLGSGMQPADEPPRPFLWYQPEEREKGLYLVLYRDAENVWRVSHAEFGDGERPDFCVYDMEGVIATVRGDTLYPQVRTLLTIDLTFASFDPAEAEAHTRAILHAPEEYRCYGLECMENGICQDHGIYLLSEEDEMAGDMAFKFAENV